MEPVTHFLTGACIGRAGFNRKTAYATLAAVLAAEAADLDVFWGFAGPVEELKHHRGITHTFWAVPVVAGVVVVGVAPVTAASACPPWRLVLQKRPRRASRCTGAGSTRPPSSPRSVTCCSTGPTTTACARSSPSIPAGTRAASCLSSEPLLWGLFFLAFFMPWVLGLTDREIGARREPFRGRGWAIFALAAMRGAGLLALGRARAGAGHDRKHATSPRSRSRASPSSRTL